MPAATITLKVSAEEKRRLQTQARREKKSLNAYVLGKVAGADVSSRGRVDYAKLNAGLNAKLGSLKLWESLGDLRG